MKEASLRQFQCLTRRHFFEECRVGVGAIALAQLLRGEATTAAPASEAAVPRAARGGHFPARAKSVIYLFMAGGPSQLDLFDPKPALTAMHGQPIPESFTKGKRFAFMDTFSKERPKLLASARKFQQHGASAAFVSECLPCLAGVVDNLAFIHSVTTEPVNHAPAKLYMNTGTAQFGRPSMGAWISYGIGTESADLPGFVVLQSGPRGPRGGAPLWGSGFLPSTHQGVPFRAGSEPIVDLARPTHVNAVAQREAIDAITAMNRKRHEVTGDPEILARINAYEMAYRMQTSAPELVDLSRESKHTLALYGVDPGTPSFATNCLLARRLVERGVRFVQLYHTDWDHHGGPGQTLGKDLDVVCNDIDRGCAALILDLKSRGLLDETLVVWGGEFGRTPMGEIRENVGRNHHVDAFTMWVAGGGTKPGITLGKTDEFGFGAVEGTVATHDIQATILQLLGLNHEKLTYRFQGRDFRLTDVDGRVVTELLA